MKILVKLVGSPSFEEGEIDVKNKDELKELFPGCIVVTDSMGRWVLIPKTSVGSIREKSG